MYGSFVNLGNALTAEIMGTAEFDWLVIDLEHGTGGEAELVTQLQALESKEVGAIVRVEAIDLPRFMHALDLGADGVLAPRLRSVEDARRCVDYCRYAALRGVARSSRSRLWGLSQRSLAEIDGDVVCAVQIETAEALELVDEIAAVDGVDLLFVGPVDLAHALELSGAADDPELLERASAVARAARANGKAAGVLTPTVDELRGYLQLGFTFLGCSSDGSLLAKAAATLAAALQGLPDETSTTR